MEISENEIQSRLKIYKRVYYDLLLKGYIIEYKSGKSIGSIFLKFVSNFFYAPNLSVEFNDFSNLEKQYAEYIRTFSMLIKSRQITLEDLSILGLPSILINEIIIGKYSKPRECRDCSGSGIYMSKKTLLKSVCRECKNGIYYPFSSKL